MIFDPAQYPNFLLMIIGTSGLFLLARGTWIMWEGDGASAWPTVQGVVQRSSVKDRMRATATIGGAAFLSRQGGHEVVVQYAYEIGGHTYVSDRWSYAGGEIYPDSVGAEKRARDFREGSPVTVHYDPTDPASAVIKCGDRGQSLGMWLSGGASFLWALYGFLSK